MKSEELNAELKTTKELDLVIQLIEGTDYLGTLCAHAVSFFCAGSNDRSPHNNIRSVIREYCISVGWDEQGANGYTNRIMTGARQYLSYIRKKLKLKRLYSHLPKSNFLNQDKQLF